jgi:hypothetical protein
MRSAALLACLLVLAVAVGTFVFGSCSGGSELLPEQPAPVTGNAADADSPRLAHGSIATKDPTRVPRGDAATPEPRNEVPPFLPEPVDERPGSLVVLVRHQSDGRPAVGVNLRVVASDALHQPGQGPTVNTALLGSDWGAPRRVATGLALGRARVGPDGSAHFVSLPPGRHVLRDDRSGVDVAVRIEPGVTTAIEHAIASGVRVEGAVVRPDGAPVAGAVVEAWPNDGEVEIETLATTDWAGRFAVDDVRPGCSYGVRAEEHFASASHRIDTRAVQQVRVELQPDACALEGFVVTGAQQPIADAVVHVGPMHGYGPRGLWTRTDARGHFRLFGLDCDEHLVAVKAAGFHDRLTRAVVETPTQFVLEKLPE